MQRHRSHVALGLVTLIAGMMISPSLVAWMSPTVAGLILAIVLSWASGQLWIGLALKKLGLLKTPEETTVPPIATRANALFRELDRNGFDGADGLMAIRTDAAAARRAFRIPAPGNHRRRGQIEVDSAVAAAKLAEARTVEEATGWLKKKERMAVMADAVLLNRFVSLPSPKVEEPATKAAELKRRRSKIETGPPVSACAPISGVTASASADGHRHRHEGRDVSLQAGDLAHQGGGDVSCA